VVLLFFFITQGILSQILQRILFRIWQIKYKVSPYIWLTLLYIKIVLLQCHYQNNITQMSTYFKLCHCQLLLYNFFLCQIIVNHTHNRLYTLVKSPNLKSYHLLPRHKMNNSPQILKPHLHHTTITS